LGLYFWNFIFRIGLLQFQDLRFLILTYNIFSHPFNINYYGSLLILINTYSSHIPHAASHYPHHIRLCVHYKLFPSHPSCSFPVSISVTPVNYGLNIPYIAHAASPNPYHSCQGRGSRRHSTSKKNI
jgi:hypothetical protein